MSEARWVTRWILLIYLTTTGVFLGILFAIWYDKLYDELVFEKSRILRDTHRTIVLSIVNARFTPLKQACKDISAAANVKFAVIDTQNVLCSTLSYELTSADIKAFDEDRYKGKFHGIYKNKIYFTSLMRSGGFFLGQGEFDDEPPFERGFGGRIQNGIQGQREFQGQNGEFGGNFERQNEFGGQIQGDFGDRIQGQSENQSDFSGKIQGQNENQGNFDEQIQRQGNFGEQFQRQNEFQNKRGFFHQGKRRHGFEGRGFLYTFIEGEDVSEDLFFVRLKVLLCAAASFALIGFVGYFLVRVALKPLESKISMLNSFIKDFTHEINTPLSVILLSIEQLEKQADIEKTKFARMKLAAKTLSQTYSDLIFLTFPDTIPNEEEKISLKNAISERLEYFRLFFEQKKLNLNVNLRGNATIFANKSKINKMLDNLISNAIKYNKKGGSIAVSLDERTLSIKDSGYGIDEKNLAKIFDRYARFNNDQGGFGIGLSLVKSICKEYNLDIVCHSKLGEGSEFVLKW